MEGESTKRTSLAFIDDQSLPSWDLLKDGAKVAGVGDGLVGGDENVILEFRIPNFRFIVQQFIPPHDLAALGFAIVRNYP